MQPLKNITIGEALGEAVKLYRDKPAIEYRGSVLSYLELDIATDYLATGFLTLGITHGTRVGIWSELDDNLLLSYYALQKIGAVTVMLSTALTMEDMIGQLRQTDCEWLMVGRFYSDLKYEDVETAVEADSGVEILHMTTEYTSAEMNLNTAKLAGSCMSRNTLREEIAKVQPSDPSMILFVSGGNRIPETVETTHGSCVNHGVRQSEDMHAVCADRFCVVLPMAHCLSSSANILAALAAGACLVLTDDCCTAAVLRSLSERKCTVLNADPATFQAIISQPDFDQYDLSSVRVGVIGGGAYTAEQFEEVEHKFGMTLLSGLGQV